MLELVMLWWLNTLRGIINYSFGGNNEYGK